MTKAYLFRRAAKLQIWCPCLRWFDSYDNLIDTHRYLNPRVGFNVSNTQTCVVNSVAPTFIKSRVSSTADLYIAVPLEFCRFTCFHFRHNRSVSDLQRQHFYEFCRHRNTPHPNRPPTSRWARYNDTTHSFVLFHFRVPPFLNLHVTVSILDQSKRPKFKNRSI